MSNFLKDLNLRFDASFQMPNTDVPLDLISTMAARGSCRAFREDEVDPNLIEILCATALASPTKSDLQQRDIIVMRDPDAKTRLVDLISGEIWVKGAPHIAVFCANNRRQRQTHEMRGHDFANDHLDAFFNAAVDAGIALSAFVTAAEALGLGCCPISAVRNEAEAVSALLGLPDHVFPVSAVAFGYPNEAVPKVSLRLPLTVTVHEDRYTEKEEGAKAAIDAYDARRSALQPFDTQRAPEVFGRADNYGWSEDKTRQYALPERQGFGAFIRSKGFNLS